METGKKEFSAVVVKAFRVFPRYFRCLTASPGRAVRSWSWRGTSMVRGLISERSYPWAVEPAGLNGSIRERVVCCWILATYADAMYAQGMTGRPWAADECLQ
jgi:hypothetical protein